MIGFYTALKDAIELKKADLEEGESELKEDLKLKKENDFWWMLGGIALMVVGLLLSYNGLGADARVVLMAMGVIAFGPNDY